MRKYFVLITLSVLMMACSFTSVVPDSVMNLFQTPTPTPMPIPELDLAPILIQEGDFPEDYAPGTILDEQSNLSKNAPTPDYAITQLIFRDGDAVGIMDVLVYEDIADTETAYESILEEIPTIGAPTDELAPIDVGEYGELGKNLEGIEIVTLAFVRCHAAVQIQMIRTLDEDLILSFANKLDQRLDPFVCR